MRINAWFLIILPVGCNVFASGDLEERMQAVLDRGISRYDVNGVSAAVVFPDGSIWRGVSGVSHGDTAISPDMVFAIGSITKNVVAALTLKLAERGILSLDDPLQKWLGSYPHVDGTITIRQLLNHTSGIYMFWNNQQIWDDLMAKPGRVFAPDDVLTYIKEPHFAKGEGWAYSNTNYLLLAMILEKATAEKLPNLVRSELVEPNGLHPLYFSTEDPTPQNQAHIYGDDNMFGKGDVDITFKPRAAHESIGYGSSGIFTTAEILALL